MGLVMKIYISYCVVSMLAGGSLMIADAMYGFHLRIENLVAVLWLGPLGSFLAIIALIILAKVWS